MSRASRRTRLRQRILRRVDDHMHEWWYGRNLQSTKLFSEIEELIDEHDEETLRDSSHDE
jgi:hypothetical protein